MKILTRISILLFAALLGLNAGAILVLKSALWSQHTAFREAREDSARAGAQARARQNAAVLAAGILGVLETSAADLQRTAADVGKTRFIQELLTLEDPHALSMAARPEWTSRESLPQTDLLALFTREGTQVPLTPGGLTAGGAGKGIEKLPPIPLMLASQIRAAVRQGHLALLTDAPEPWFVSSPAVKDPFIVAFEPVRREDRSVAGVIACGRTLSGVAGTIQDLRKDAGAQQEVPSDEIQIALYSGGRRVTGLTSALDALASTLTSEEWQALMETGGGGALANNRHTLYRRMSVGDSALGVSVPVRAVRLPPVSNDRVILERELRNAVGLIAALAIVALSLAILGVQRILKPIRRLRKRAEAVSTGKMDASFKDLSGKDDIGEMARSFERMRISIRKLLDRHPNTPEKDRTAAEVGTTTGEYFPSRSE